MAIKIQTQNPPSAHDEAAEAVETAISKTVTKAGEEGVEPISQQHEYESTPVPAPVPMERLTVGMSFKLPVASYTMLEFVVHRTVPFNPLEADPDTVFDETKAWVEGKLNALIAEQQSES